MKKDAILYGLLPYVVQESQRWSPNLAIEIVTERSTPFAVTYNQPTAIVCVKPDGEPEEYMMVPWHFRDGVVSQVDTILHPTAEQVQKLRAKGVLPTR